ncbi:MAG: putative sulfate exporter family transporter, partial [Brevundimonas diminuta]|nr:putative sulfate exporter family transporter [Brevundimonas diminuta]
MTVTLDPAAPSRRLTGLARLLPGVALSAAIGAVAYGLQIVETRLFEHPWIEGLVLAILIGA